MQIAISKDDGTYVLWVDGEIKGCITETGISKELIEEIEIAISDLKGCLCKKQIEEMEIFEKEKLIKLKKQE